MEKNTKKNATSVKWTDRLAVWLRTPLAGRIFVVSSGMILLCTVLLWTLLTASLHEANADQLIDSFLFENARTFTEAWFPGAHTFLLKWPLFAIMALFGTGPNVFLFATIFMVLATIGGLVFVLWRIEKRPFVFGVYCLALASILLMIPAQPYPGALLPVNMAMTTTRNLEYLVLLLALWVAASQPRVRSWPALGVGVALTVLIASDKLFAVLAVGACLFAAVWFGLILRRRAEALRALGWFVVVIAAFGAATVGLLALNALGITGIVGGESASPFAVITSVKEIIVALIYGIGALLTNFGANPLHGVLVLGDIPSALAAAVQRPSILPYAANLALLAIGLYAAFRLLFQFRRSSGASNVKPDAASSRWQSLSVFLVGATLAAGAVFVLTDHYYPVDSRYLAVSLFAVAVAAAAYFSTRKLRVRTIGIASLVLVALLPIGIAHTFVEYSDSLTALYPRNHVTYRVSEELQNRDVERLVGDYWNITPVKTAMSQRLTVAAVDNCTIPRPVLNSKAWFTMPQNTSTAFLAIRDGSAEAGPNFASPNPASGATYGGCSLEKIVGSYGTPSERIHIDSTVNENGLSDALLLLYPNGVKSDKQAEAERKAIEKPATPVRKNLTAMQSLADCKAGVSLQVVAHQDDDLLFMNPDVLDSIKSGHCVRTVYVTAGNAGENVNYWGGRELGAKAAYAEMFGVKNEWHDEWQYVDDHKVTVSYLSNVPKVSLVFMRLPDGNLHGEGFPGDGHASLHGLLSGSLASVAAVDDSAAYSKPELIKVLQGIMNADRPDEIRTLGSDNQADGDHADHHDVGLLTAEASAGITVSHSVTHYLGYPTRPMAVNLSNDIIGIKQRIFLSYAKHDGAVCQTVEECNLTPTYGSYLARQYQPQPPVPADTGAPVSIAP